MLDSSDPKTAPQAGDSVSENLGAHPITREEVRRRFLEAEEIHNSSPPNKRREIIKGPLYVRPIDRPNAPYIPFLEVRC